MNKMNNKENKILQKTTKYLNEAIEILKSENMVEIKNTFLENVKNKRLKQKWENDFDQNFIKSYVETKINNPNN
jgi:hypothetical protein